MGRRSLGPGGIVALASVLLVSQPAPTLAAAGTVDASQLPPGEFEGILRRVPGTDRIFTVTVTVPQVTVNPNVPATVNVQRHINAVLQIQQQMRRSRNPAAQLHQLQSAVNRLQVEAAKAQASSIRVTTVTHNIDFQAADDVKVRTMHAPEVFDDKGKVRKHTAEELKQLKGKDPNLAGYESSLDALMVGQVVHVSLSRHRTAPAEKGKEGKEDPDKEKPADKDAGKKKPVGDGDNAEKKMQVRMIVIVSNGAARSDSREKPSKDQ
jgi:hypothetical protein